MSEKSRTPDVPANPGTHPPVLVREATLTTDAIFQINTVKLYIPVATLSTNDSNKFFKYLK